MQVSDLIVRPDEAILKMIRKDLGEDSQRLEKQKDLFREWLKCEPYLPNSIDERLLENFIRQCKCDLEKAKKKFVNFLLTRIRLKVYYSNRDLTDDYFDDIMLHRQVLLCRELLPEGYRVGYARLPEDINQFDFARLFHFVLVLLDFVLIEDTCASYIGVYDLKNFSAQHIGKINLKLLAEALKLIYHVAPFRYHAMHFLNVPHIPEALIVLLKKLVPQKVIERMYVHKNSEDLAKYIPSNLLPIEYGGESIIWNDDSDRIKKFFVENKEWERKLANLKLNGTVPHHKRELYSFDDFEMGGSFRQLSID